MKYLKVSDYLIVKNCGREGTYIFLPQHVIMSIGIIIPWILLLPLLHATLPSNCLCTMTHLFDGHHLIFVTRKPTRPNYSTSYPSYFYCLAHSNQSPLILYQFQSNNSHFELLCKNCSPPISRRKPITVLHPTYLTFKESVYDKLAQVKLHDTIVTNFQMEFIFQHSDDTHGMLEIMPSFIIVLQ